MSEKQLQEAIQLFKEGQKAEASAALTRLLETEPGNELAWLWLAACTDQAEERRYCLEKALEINPQNQKARAALERLLPSAPVETPSSAAAADAEPEPAPPPAPAVMITRKRPARQMSLYRKILIAVFGLLMLVVLGFIFIAFISGAFSF